MYTQVLLQWKRCRAVVEDGRGRCEPFCTGILVFLISYKTDLHVCITASVHAYYRIVRIVQNSTE
jgi:hypothetical protein